MEYLASLIVLASALLFKWMGLNARKIQEKGLSPLGVLYYHRFAIYPALLLTVLTFRKEYIEIIFSNNLLILALFFSVVFWSLIAYIYYFTLNSVNNLSSLNAFEAIISLPVFVIIGIFLNNDIPNAFILIALVILGVALLIKPEPHKLGRKKFFKHSLLLIIIFTLGVNIFSAVNVGLYRVFLQNLDSTLFSIGICAFLAMLPLWLLPFFRKLPAREMEIVRQNKYLAYSIAPIWFLASIPEGYAFLNVPIYTLIAIASITFVINVLSDLRNKRIHFNFRTGIFIILVLVSIGFSVLSLG